MKLNFEIKAICNKQQTEQRNVQTWWSETFQITAINRILI